MRGIMAPLREYQPNTAGLCGFGSALRHGVLGFILHKHRKHQMETRWVVDYRSNPREASHCKTHCEPWQSLTAPANAQMALNSDQILSWPDRQAGRAWRREYGVLPRGDATLNCTHGYRSDARSNSAQQRFLLCPWIGQIISTGWVNGLNRQGILGS